MFRAVDFSPHVFFCCLAIFVTYIWLNFRHFVNRIHSVFQPNVAIRPATGTADHDINKLSSLPEGWWTEDTIFQLEQRAIFSKTWICVSHRSRFLTPGDYVSYEVAGFRFFLILGKDKVVRAFHNVCRHRAFPITKKASGSSSVLGCKYHGWSYDTKGQLIKAPQFDHVAGFDKSQNSLFEIHTKLDSYGFLHINLSGNRDAGDSELLGERKVGRPARINLKSRYLCSLQYKGKFNWKVAANAPFQIDSEPSSKSSRLRAFSTHSSTSPDQLHFFPFTTVYAKAGDAFWYQISYSPDSAQRTTVLCDVYSTRNDDSIQFDEASKDNLKSQIKSNIESYEEEYVKLVSSSEDLPEDSSYDQWKVADVVRAHLKKESIEGKEIKLATVQQCRSSAFSKAEEICRAMECASDKLAW